MCHALVILDVPAAVFVSNTEGVQFSTGTLTGVGIHRDVTASRVYLLPGYNSLLNPLYFTLILFLRS